MPYSSHAYAEEGSNNFGVTVQDDGNTSTPNGSTATSGSTATVTDAPLSPTGASLSGSPGTALSNVTVATFTDADSGGSLSDYSASITWGDGNVSTGTISAGSGSTWVVKGTNTYANAGIYTIGVRISDSGGSATTVASTATITAPAWTLTGWQPINDPWTKVLGAGFGGGAGGPFGPNFLWTGGLTLTQWGLLTHGSPMRLWLPHHSTTGGAAGGASGMSWTSITTGTGWSTGAGSLGGGVFSDAGDDWSGALLVPVGELTAAVNTGGLRANHPLDFDLSPGNTVGGSPALDYNSDTVSVRPIIESTLTTDASLGVPTQINTAGGWCRLAAPNPVKK